MGTGIVSLIRALPSMARVKTITLIFPRLQARRGVVWHGGVPGSAVKVGEHVCRSVQGSCVSRVLARVMTGIAGGRSISATVRCRKWEPDGARLVFDKRQRFGL
jgi:hypothetical protein